jgi:N-acetylglucosaminyl-diphospho-decaprenol L-rhamnosyltransferase
MMATVLTVILNWRTPDMTLRAAEAALTAMAGIPGAITIVDNDSAATGRSRMTEEAPRGAGIAGRARAGDAGRAQRRLWRGQQRRHPRGPAGGARPDYVYILNSDAFPAPDAIRALLDHLEPPPATGFAGSYIHGTEGDPHTHRIPLSFRLVGVRGAARTGPVSRLLRRRIVARWRSRHRGDAGGLAGGRSLMMRHGRAGPDRPV